MQTVREFTVTSATCRICVPVGLSFQHSPTWNGQSDKVLLTPMNDYNNNPRSSTAILIAGRAHTDPILKDPDMFPYWNPREAAIIYGYSVSHIYKYASMGIFNSFQGVHGLYIYTTSLNAHVDRVSRS